MQKSFLNKIIFSLGIFFAFSMFAKTPQQIEVPNLLQLQQSSYESFLMLDQKDRSKSGIERVFQSVFPIHDAQNRLSLEYLGSEVGWGLS